MLRAPRRYTRRVVRLLALVIGLAACQTTAPRDPEARPPEGAASSTVTRTASLREDAVAPPLASAAGAAPAPPARGATDVTFLVTADTHLGHADMEQRQARAIDAMNDIAGTPWPAVIGGTVGAPRGVLVAGDLTETGEPADFARFEALFGLTGRDGRLRVPVFETYGNHDKIVGPFVKEQMARRHGDIRYAWDWDGVHFVCFGEAPDETDRAWLARDLEGVAPDVGLVLLFHFPLEGPYSTGQWFGDGDHREALASALAGRAVLGIFHGHYHATGAYRWHGIDAYNPGSAKHGGHGFLAVHVGDERMTVGSYSYVLGRFIWWHDKPIFGAKGAEKLSLEGAIVGRPGWR